MVIMLVMIKSHHWRTQEKMRGGVSLGVEGKLSLVKASLVGLGSVLQDLRPFGVVWRRSNSMDEL